MRRRQAGIERVEASAYTVPTDSPEADGSAEWHSTTLVLVEVEAGGKKGLGYSYGHASAARIVRDPLAPLLVGADALALPEHWVRISGRVRNMGRPGVASTALAALDVALWDLKARLLEISMLDLLGSCRDAVAIYGSGGFTTYAQERLERQLAGWVEQGIGMVKMKIGSDPARDPERVRAARNAIGPEAELFVDANGAYSVKQALAVAERCAEERVTWFEEPVSSDNLRDLALMRLRAPPGMAIAAGEYGYDLAYFRRMLDAAAVDVLQADATRCGGVTGFMAAAALADAFDLPLSAHTAPNLHAHLGCAAPRLVHVEYFHDHARLEPMLFDGALSPKNGQLAPDRGRRGLGLELKSADSRRFRVDWT